MAQDSMGGGRVGRVDAKGPMMKAIGKRSLASILAVILHGIRIVLWIAFAGLTAAVFIVPLVPAIVNFAVNAGGVDVTGDIDVTFGDYVEIVAHFITFGVLLFVVDRLLELLRTLRFGSPFVADNAIRFRRIGVALLFGEAAQFFLSIFGHAFDADIDGGLDLITLVSIAAVFVLSEVFREGAKMKEEQDLTV